MLLLFQIEESGICSLREWVSMDPENYSEGPEFDGSERHYIGSLLDEDASSPKKQGKD